MLRRHVDLAALALSLTVLSGCERESRRFDPPAPGADVGDKV